MKVQFIKNCPCKVDRKIVHYKMGTVYDVPKSYADWMLKCGYAMHVETVETVDTEKSINPQTENKSLDPVSEDKGIVKPKKQRGRPRKDKEMKND